jgi:glycerol kinase
LFSARHVEVDLWDWVFCVVEHRRHIDGKPEKTIENNRLSVRWETNLCAEGVIFIAGAVVQWLRDGLKIIHDAKETQPLAQTANQGQELYMVPAFTGLGAPYWDADARGAIYGLTRNSGPAELARAALESVGSQTRDLLEAIKSDWKASDADGVLRVDGGMGASDWSMQFLSDIIDAPVDRPTVLEATALGVAWLAGMRAGVYPDQEGFAAYWALERRFEPAMDATQRERRYAGWKDAVRRTLTTA